MAKKKNVPYKTELHLNALVATGAKLTLPNAFGDSPNNAYYASFDAYGLNSDKFRKKCKALNLHFGWYGIAGYPPNVGSTYVVAKYVKTSI